MRRSIVVSLVLVLTGVVLVACGTTADELRPTFAPTSTFNFESRIAIQQTRSAEQADVIAVAQDSGDDAVEPAAIAPTATPRPATSTPMPATPTPEPTEVVEEPTEAVSAEVDVHDRFPDLPASADPATGDLLFHNIVAPDTGQNCTTCHNVEEPIPGTGPYLYGIANLAGQRMEGIGAVEYLFNSIKYPNDFIAPAQGDSAWGAGVMPQSWSQVLADDDIYHIVAYLLTLDQTE